MLILNRQSSALLLIDFQSRLMPAIENGAAVVANARRLLTAAAMFEVPALITEENPAGLGGTLPELAAEGTPIFCKMSFDACRMPGFLDRLPDRPDLVVAGCETHVCVLQTALGLIDTGRRVWSFDPNRIRYHRSFGCFGICASWSSASRAAGVGVRVASAAHPVPNRARHSSHSAARRRMVRLYYEVKTSARRQ